MKISIKNKIFISFLMLNIFVFSLLIILFVHFFKENNRNFIDFDLKKVLQDSNSYVERFMSDNQIGFVNTIYDNREQLLEELNSIHNAKGVIYDLDGKIIAGQVIGIKVFYNDIDLKNALNRRASYTIYEKEHTVSFSMPLIVGGEVIGIYRIEKDYSQIFRTSNYFSRIILIFGGLSLLFVFIISLVISRKISEQILVLKTATNKIAAQNYEVDIEVKSSDEIGELADNFKVMQERVKEHIITIKKDKELLSELLEHRKKFFDRVTHELKTPLTTIQAYTQVIASNGLEDEDFVNKGITHILEESIRLHKLVLSLLDLSENNSINFETNTESLNISKILEGICESMSIKAEGYNIDIVKNIEPSLEIRGYRDEIKGVFINLIDNAIKYAGNNTLIKVTAHDKTNSVEVLVSDNGIGIPEDKLDKIFEPFYRVDGRKSRETGSSGLGLSIVKKLVENHKGQITVESKVNLGTTFIVILPKNNS